MNEFDLTLDLNKSRAASPVRLRQGDLQGTTVRALILDHGATADLTGMTAQWVMDLPDGTHYYRKGGAVSGNVVSVLINEAQAASVTGRTLAYVQLLQGSTVRASTGSVVVEILPDALADATVPESYDSAIQDAIDALDEAVEQMPDMVEDVLEAHPEWTTTVHDGSISKAKLATDLARDRERLLYRLANMLTNALPEGETATASDAAQTPMAGLALYGRSTQDGTPTPSAPVAIQSVGGNLYQQTMFAAGTTRTTGGVTVTYNEDGTCTVSGTATSNAWLWGGSSSSDARLYVTLPAGTYTICGSHSVIAQKMVGSTVSNIVSQTMRQATFTLTEETLVKAVPVIPSGTTVSGETAWVALYAGSTLLPYVPYGHVGLWAKRTSDASTYTVTPIDLDGHELRSLPDGTRDELAVDGRGHAVLVQRVGSYTVTGNESAVGGTALGSWRRCRIIVLGSASSKPANEQTNDSGLCSNAPYSLGYSGQFLHVYANIDDVFLYAQVTNDADLLAAYEGATVLYPLATPVTIDLGYVAAVPLCGPDLTAQAIPTAPFALTYERDLNATLARLESAIAELATN